MEEQACSRNSTALHLVHEHFAHERAVVIHTNSEATRALTTSDLSPDRSNIMEKSANNHFRDMTHMCALMP